jgi:hypothetical protein
MRIRVKEWILPTFALAQMRCEKGAVDANLAAIAQTYAEAGARGAAVVATPEMSLTGYIDPARQPEAVLSQDSPAVAQLVALTAGGQATLLAGLVEAHPAGLPFITHVAARHGRLLGFYRKVTIKDEEAAWFSPGDGVPVFRHDDLTFGIAICADIGTPKCSPLARARVRRSSSRWQRPACMGSRPPVTGVRASSGGAASAARTWPATRATMGCGLPSPPRPAAPSTRTSPAVAIFSILMAAAFTRRPTGRQGLPT